MEATPDAEIQVTWEDQQNINAFSRFNAKLEDLQVQYEDKKLELEYLDDLAMELELADEDEPTSYKIGDIFIDLSLEEAQNRLQSEKDRLDYAIDAMKNDMDEIETKLAELKKTLYGKFKTAINLEKD
ncbi:hypothetical protein H4R35_002140 [Dimargaris xerosporica]|nr:hypothetical protein H4R35_002140 [Dimargaris xerosporica]